MLSLTETPEFQAIFRADLAVLRTRAGEALAWLMMEPDNAGAQADLGTALHGLKGLAGMAAARPLSRTVSLLERAGDLASRLARMNPDGARELFAACLGPAGEFNAVLEATAGGGGKESETEDAARRLADAITARWPELNLPPNPLPDPQALAEVFPARAPAPAAADPAPFVPPDPAEEDDVLAFLQELGVEPPAPTTTTETPAAVPASPAADYPAPPLSPAVADPTLAETASIPDGTAPEADAVDLEMLQYFVPETAEYCEGIEKALADMGETDRDGAGAEEPRRELMRYWHTIKGAANSIGLSTLGRLSHTVEDAFEENSPLNGDEQRRIGTAATDILRDFLRGCAGGATAASPTAPVEALATLLGNLRAAAIIRQTEPAVPEAVVPSMPATEDTAPTAPDAGTPDAPLTTPTPTADVAEAASFEAPSARVDPATLDGLMNLVGELTVSRNRLMAKVATFTALQSEMESCKNRLLRVVGNFQERHEYSTPATGNGNGNGGNRGLSPHRPAGFGELEFDAYDEVNLLSRALMEIGADTGELIDQSRRFFTGFAEDSDQFRKVSTQLQETITQVRMVPLNGLFRRLRRVAADAARIEGKEIEWLAEGGETRLDKVIVESVFSPLLHLVRNAVGHGVETPAAREAAGKPRAGSLWLNATQKSGHVVIELRDDGGGLDFQAIRRRGVSAGLLTAEEAADAGEEQLVGLIFKSGFSTRETSACNEVSGRGIGMDAVLQQVTRLNGTIEVESRAGRGCTLILKLPVTLAIGQAMFVRVGGQTFALPLAFVDRLAPCPPEAVETDTDGQENLRVETSEGGTVPMMRMEDLLGLPRSEDLRSQISNLKSGEAPPSSPRPLAVIARVADRRVAFPIEAMLRRDDIVTKNLGPLLADHPCFAGATIDTDGHVVLILDVPRLAQDFFARRGVFALVGARVTAFRPPTVRVKPVVMVVDDSLSVRKVAEKLVVELGYEAETATDGIDALEKLARRSFVCVLTDLEMPRMDGFDLLSEIRGRPSTQELPVIVVTSRQAEKHRVRASALGATDYLTKPFTKTQLAEKLAACRVAPTLVEAA